MTFPKKSPVLRWLALFSLAVVFLTGCKFDGLYGVPLPGGVASTGGFQVKIEFADVLDLVPQSAVKVNNVTVGSVAQIDLVRANIPAKFAALVTINLDKSVSLPDNVSAAIQQTSLLGEKFVALQAPPAGQAVGKLSAGDLVPMARTSRDVEVEEVLGALSLVLNGGAIQQIQTINRELSTALSGREPQVRSLLTELNTFVGTLDTQKANIVRALQGLNRLAAILNSQKTVFTNALDSIGPGLKVLADQRSQLTQTLTALSKLGAVGTHVINASKADTLADLRALQPTLKQLAAAGTSLPNGLELLSTFPFPRKITDTIFISNGRAYANVDFQVDLDLTEVLGNLLTPGKTPIEAPDTGGTGSHPIEPPDSIKGGQGTTAPVKDQPGVTIDSPDSGLGGILGGGR
ncbi:MCE family protein [Fodinicola acaciae]|uniref:MCE family protein n=1 Tax=Fodinicola acaciae TaxID=2681555 RepID=UPI0013D3267F|nr:MCE family protein [Fodinicola acaciae]